MEIIKKTFPSSFDDRGKLTFIEGSHDFPFDIKRVYYIYDVEKSTARGFHAHKKLEQYLICLNGTCKIALDDGNERETVTLCSANEGLYIAPGIWRERCGFAGAGVRLLL